MQTLTKDPELDALKEQKEKLKAEMESMRNLFIAENDKKFQEARKAVSSVEEARKKLETDRATFEGILKTFQKEKLDFELEKAKVNAIKHDAERQMENIGVFVRMIRDGAAKL